MPRCLWKHLFAATSWWQRPDGRTPMSVDMRRYDGDLGTPSEKCLPAQPERCLADVPIGIAMRPTGVEPATFGLKGRTCRDRTSVAEPIHSSDRPKGTDCPVTRPDPDGFGLRPSGFEDLGIGGGPIRTASRRGRSILRKSGVHLRACGQAIIQPLRSQPANHSLPT